MRKTIIGCILVLCTAVAHAGQDEIFVAARQAFQAGDRVRLAAYVPQLHGYLLEPYARYWQLKLGLDDADTQDVRAFLEANVDTPLAERLRSDWLKVLGKRQDWEPFDQEFPLLPNPDSEIQCYGFQRRLARNDLSALAEARPLWFAGRDQPQSCDPVFAAMLSGGRLTTQDVWTRIRLALELGQTGVAKRLFEYLPRADAPAPKAFDAAAENPRRFLERRQNDLHTRSGRELAVFALIRIARTSPPEARAEWLKIRSAFPEQERRYMAGHLAYQGALKQVPEALAWFREAGPRGLSDAQLGWMVRAALRAEAWEDVIAAVDAMSPEAKQQSVWRYWKARALKSKGRVAEMNALLAPISVEQNFYGRLALEELGPVLEQTPERYQPTREDVQAMSQIPALQRALALFRVDMRLDGIREWAWGIRGLDDRQLLAAAELAERSGHYDRAIATAEKTKEVHDFNVRYPIPYRELIRVYARQARLDEPWVYGLMRQESRFQVDIVSSAGAVGLMQLMPATARWVARRIGMNDFRQSMVTDIETNISLGTYYLRHVYELFDGSPVLASAAYNAGPGRARQWRAVAPMEGAIYAESIPFDETRDYVKKVLANATYYAVQLKSKFTSLNQRLGVIQPRMTEAEQPLGDTP